MEIECPKCKTKNSIQTPPPNICSGCHSYLPVPVVKGSSGQVPPPQKKPDPQKARPEPPPAAAAEKKKEAGPAKPVTESAHAAGPAKAQKPQPEAKEPGRGEIPRVVELPEEARKKIESLQSMIALNPKAKAQYLQIAQIFIDAGYKEEGIKSFERYLQIDPSDAFVRQRIDVLKGVPSAKKAPKILKPVDRRVVEREHRLWKKGLAYGGGALALLIVVAVVKLVFFPSARLVATVGKGNCIDPVWSPRGDTIAFLKESGATTSLCLYEMDEGAVRDLTPLNSFWGSEFRWSPDGTEIAYVDDAEQPGYWGTAIFVLRISDGSVTKVADGGQPTWAPDGLRFAFISPPPASYWDLYASDDETGSGAPRKKKESEHPAEALCVADLTTGKVERIAAISGSTPAWSPKGEQIVFQYEEPVSAEERRKEEQKKGATQGVLDQRSDMTEMLERALESGGRTAGEAEQGLTREAMNMQRRDQDANSSLDALLNPTDIYSISANGTGLKKLTEGGRSASPRWVPGADKILYTFYPPGQKRKGELWVMNADGSGKQKVLGEGASISYSRTAAALPGLKGFLFEGWVQETPAVMTLMTLGSSSDLFYLKAGREKPKRLTNKHPFKQNFSVDLTGENIAYQVLNKERNYEIWRMKF